MTLWGRRQRPRALVGSWRRRLQADSEHTYTGLVWWVGKLTFAIMCVTTQYMQCLAFIPLAWLQPTVTYLHYFPGILCDGGSLMMVRPGRLMWWYSCSLPCVLWYCIAIVGRLVCLWPSPFLFLCVNPADGNIVCLDMKWPWPHALTTALLCHDPMTVEVLSLLSSFPVDWYFCLERNTSTCLGGGGRQQWQWNPSAVTRRKLIVVYSCLSH